MGNGENGAPRLLIDGTAGRLARALRWLGYDADYIDSTDPVDVMRTARAAGRMIVTRSQHVAAKPGPALILEGDGLKQQVRQVQRQIGKADQEARCPHCNQLLVELSSEAARGRVPPFVWRNEQQFAQCPACRRIYWPGTHIESFQQYLQGRINS